MALLGLFGKKDWGDHPLADPKVARESLDAVLRAGGANPVLALEDVSVWLEPLPHADNISLERRAEMVMQLDDAAAAAARRLAREYLTAARNRSQEFRYWQTATGYWRKLIAAYENCLERAEGNPKGQALLNKLFLPLLYARLLNAYGALLKWEQFRYGPVEGALWQAAGCTYLRAAQARVAAHPLTLYANWPGETSVEREYLKLLVFHAASMNNLLPLEIELAERLMAHFMSLFVLTAESSPENVYWVDAGQAQPPSRLLRPPVPTPGLRYFRTAAAGKAMEMLRATIAQTGQVPADVALGGQYPAETLVRVLDHLALCCSPTPPQRHHDRHQVKSLLAVIHGRKEIALRLEGESGTQEGETWVADDVSLGGLGAQVSLVANDWIKVGVLVGMRPEGGDNWLVGVVRRFGRENNNTGAVGVETLGRSPRAVTVECLGKTHHGILLDAALSVGDEARLLIDPALWEDFMPVVVTCDGSQAKLRPGVILAQGEDFLVGRYQVAEIG
ncbi:MAG: hypothetical protein EKK46_16420 [Rhodocyclaceae bacterium]|nr:MAG: hypothetical protein EKK46_16420 [Rhodocyclaceae bacterium]